MAAGMSEYPTVCLCRHCSPRRHSYLYKRRIYFIIPNCLFHSTESLYFYGNFDHFVPVSIPGSKLTFSTNVFHHSLLTPIPPDCLLGLYWTGLTLLNGFSFLVIFSYYFGSCGRLSWLNCQLSSAR